MNHASESPTSLPAGAAIHAGFWRRWAAWAVDAPVFLLLTFGLLEILDLTILRRSGFVMAGVAIAAPSLYFALMEGSSWQATPGKRMMGIKVVDLHGRRIGFWRALGRFVLPWGLLFGSFVVVPIHAPPSDLIPFWCACIVIAVGYAMSGWTARKQTLFDMLTGTCVVFSAVQPGQPLPVRRLPLPWYGWLVNVAAFLALGVAVEFPSRADYTVRAYATEALGMTDLVRQEVESEGCRPGSRPSPSPKVAAIEVADASAGRCTITLTLGQFPRKAAVLNGGRIALTRGENGQWTCLSSLPNKYLPVICRR
jgi:uncharacterized RDD family membrane protein YckC